MDVLIHCQLESEYLQLWGLASIFRFPHLTLASLSPHKEKKCTVENQKTGGPNIKDKIQFKKTCSVCV